MRIAILAAALVLTGACGMFDPSGPSGPQIDLSGNNGQITQNFTSGSSSPIGTAPCGATSSQKAAPNQPAGSDCSTATAEPFVVPAAE